MNAARRFWAWWSGLFHRVQSPQQELLSGFMDRHLRVVGTACLARFIIHENGAITPIVVAAYDRKILMRWGHPWREAEKVLCELPYLMGSDVVYVEIVFWRGMFAVDGVTLHGDAEFDIAGGMAERPQMDYFG